MQQSDAIVTAMRRHEWVGNLPWQYVEMLAAISEPMRFAPGEILFPQGETPRFFQLITSGQVAIEAEMDRELRVVQTLHEGEQLGWSALLGQGFTHFRARALTFVETLALSGAKLREACERNPTFGYSVMKHLVHIVAERLDATRMQLAKERIEARVL